MAWITCRNANRNSRQRLGRRGLFWGQVVAPGGNGLADPDQPLRQQRNQELSKQPRTDALVILFGDVAQLHNGFQTLKRQFDLPPQSIAFQHRSRGCLLFS